MISTPQGNDRRTFHKTNAWLSGLRPFPRSNGLPSPRELRPYARCAVRVVADVSQATLTVLQSGGLKKEVVEIPGFTRVKTNLDRLSYEWLVEGLRKQFPDLPIFSEATRISGEAGPGKIRSGTLYAVIDPIDGSTHLPIDGTSHLQKGDGQWLINLAFCMDGVALFGISSLPQKGRIYVGMHGKRSIVLTLAADRYRPLTGRTREANKQVERIYGVCSLLDLGGNKKAQQIWKDIARENHATRTVVCGSAYAPILVAEGKLDVFPNPYGNLHWDTAAQQVILEGSEARMLEINWDNPQIPAHAGQACRYGPETCKDEGHVAVRKGVAVYIDPKHRRQWKVAFD